MPRLTLKAVLKELGDAQTVILDHPIDVVNRIPQSCPIETIRRPVLYALPRTSILRNDEVPYDFNSAISRSKSVLLRLIQDYPLHDTRSRIPGRSSSMPMIYRCGTRGEPLEVCTVAAFHGEIDIRPGTISPSGQGGTEQHDTSKRWVFVAHPRGQRRRCLVRVVLRATQARCGARVLAVESIYDRLHI